MLLIGVLLGRGSDDSNQTPQVVTVSSETTNPPAAAGAEAPNSSGEAVGSEWPSGTDGWTVQLASLPKDGTTAADVDSIEQSISDQGVDDLGVLDADLYPSLPPGNYIVYSGVYGTRADAEAAVKKLGSAFSSAQVVEVSSQAAASGGGVSPATGAPEAEVK
jgi:septal ring-binding cell division protein DamX